MISAETAADSVSTWKKSQADQEQQDERHQPKAITSAKPDLPTSFRLSGDSKTVTESEEFSGKETLWVPSINAQNSFDTFLIVCCQDDAFNIFRNSYLCCK